MDEQLLDLFVRDRQARGCRAKTIQFYQEQLRPFIGFVRARNLSLGRVAAVDVRDHVIGELDRGLSKHSVNCRVRALRCFFGFLFDAEHLPHNPAAKLRLVPTTKKPVPVLHADTLAVLLDYFDRSSFLGARNYALTVLLLDTLLRCGEAVRLTLADFDRASRLLTVRDTKTWEDAVIPVSEHAGTILGDFLDHWRVRLPGDRIFCTRGGDPVKPNGIGQMFRKVKKRLGIDGRIYAHLMRHTGATAMVVSGAGLPAVQRMLRHSSISTTMKYVHPDLEYLAAEHRKHGFFAKTQKLSSP